MLQELVFKLKSTQSPKYLPVTKRLYPNSVSPRRINVDSIPTLVFVAKRKTLQTLVLVLSSKALFFYSLNISYDTKFVFIEKYNS